jgi:hypothetical protein
VFEGVASGASSEGELEGLSEESFAEGAVVGPSHCQNVHCSAEKEGAGKVENCQDIRIVVETGFAQRVRKY